VTAGLTVAAPPSRCGTLPQAATVTAIDHPSNAILM